MLSTSSAAKLLKCEYNKSSIKVEASVTNAATYYFLSIKGNAQILLLVILSLHPPPATLHL